MKILSGVFEDARTGGQVTTGTPISMIIENVDQRSRDYSDIADKFRPGHADYAYFAKYGVRDYRGGGRQSARETAARVAAGAIARKILGPAVVVRAGIAQIGPHAVDAAKWDWDEIGRNQFWCPDLGMVEVWETHLDAVRKAGSSTGAIVAVEATGVPAGWGAPVYGKLDAELAGALMSINAAKGVEIGAGFAAAALSGEANADEMVRGQRRRAAIPVEPGGRHPGRHLDRPAGDGAGRLQAHLLDPDPAPLAERGRRGGGGAHHRAPRPVRRPSRQPDRRGDGRLCARRRLPAPPRPDRRRRLPSGAASDPPGLTFAGPTHRRTTRTAARVDARSPSC